MKSFFKLAALIAAFGFVLIFAGCSNGSDETPIVVPDRGTTQTDNGTQPGGGTNPTPAPTPTPAATYTITFNANDGSENPATATQTFTEGVSQTLKTIAELGFSKNGFNFAGWGTTSDASESSYADGASYTASSNTTLYALWSSVPVYSVNIPFNANGSVMATPATATAGTSVTLSISPALGYEFKNLALETADGTVVPISGTGNSRTFLMPAKNVTVTAVFAAINYTITCGSCEHGSVSVSSTTATIGIEIILDNTPAIGWRLSSYSVLTSDSESIEVRNGKFLMPAKNVNVSASFSEIPSASGAYNELPAGTDGSAGTAASYVTFGLYPQTVRASNVVVDKTQKKTIGNLTCYKGSDGEYYVSAIGYSYAYEGNGTKYSDGSFIGRSDIERDFKVEPIKWCVVSKNYNGSGKKLLVAENDLFVSSFGAQSDLGNYKKSTLRRVLNNDFLMAAFTENERQFIADTTVDNSPSSSLSDTNPYSCEDTVDKVFALSVREVPGLLKKAYRKRSDYCLAKMCDGYWWTRTPCHNMKECAYEFCASFEILGSNVSNGSKGVVPALCVSN